MWRCRWPLESNGDRRIMKLSKERLLNIQKNLYMHSSASSNKRRIIWQPFQDDDFFYHTPHWSSCKWFPCKWSHFEARSMNECAWKANKSVHCLKCLKRCLKRFGSHSPPSPSMWWFDLFSHHQIPSTTWSTGLVVFEIFWLIHEFINKNASYALNQVFCFYAVKILLEENLLIYSRFLWGHICEMFESLEKLLALIKKLKI
jgi:hypothetical protein